LGSRSQHPPGGHEDYQHGSTHEHSEGITANQPGLSTPERVTTASSQPTHTVHSAINAPLVHLGCEAIGYPTAGSLDRSGIEAVDSPSAAEKPPDRPKLSGDRIFTVKAAHLAERGLANAFAEPGVEEFVRDLCHRGLAAGRPLTELHAIEGGGELLATFAGTGDGRRFSSMFNTYTPGPLSRYSPGLVLLTHMVARLGERGFTCLDLGAGDAGYKRGFCREVEPLFDSFWPLTARGHLAAAGARPATALKRTIKHTPRLWSALQTVRRQVYAR